MEKKTANEKKDKRNNAPIGLTHHQLEAILNNTNLPIYLKDADYRYILVNREFERLAQVTNDDIRGKDDFAVFPEPVARLFRDQDKEVVQRRTMVEFEETIPLPDGVHTFLTAKFPLMDSKGEINAVGGVCTDITSQKKVEELLRESKERYKRLTDNAQDMIYRMSLPDGAYEYVSSAATKIFGHTPQEFYDSPLLIRKVTHPDWLQYFEKQWKLLLAGDMPPTYEYQIIHKSGEPRWMYQRNVLLKDEDGKPVAIEGIITDITEQKLTGEALQKANDELEHRVAERTADLIRKSEMLEETNIALKVLLEKRAEDTKELEENVMFNVEKLILPYIEKLKTGCTDKSQKGLIKIIQANLEEITSSFSENNRKYLSNLTPTQMQIADLIKQGRTTKEIASLLNISPATVACHRQEIRKRLALNRKKINLRAALTANS